MEKMLECQAQLAKEYKEAKAARKLAKNRAEKARAKEAKKTQIKI